MSGQFRRDNLPAEVTGFVGRRREVVEARRQLEANRLVTLTGMGGVGKTRLALELARQARPAYPDGVWLVELASVTNPELVPGAVAAALGLADRSPRSVLSALASYLEDKRLLLVLDNCEHVLDACAPLTGKLLAAAPGLRVLATSREPLRLGGEQTLTVGPLATPDPAALPPGDLSEFEAVRLFAERASGVLPGFQVNAANRVAVAGVCRRLDGIPLAIELAAARLRVLSPEQILERLDDRFRLLTTGSRVAPARHQTLRAAVDWSHEMCSPAEQALWARVSVFAGGFDLAAAEAVCGVDGIDPGEVFDLVAALLDKSILIRESGAGAGATARYGLLETVRQYGRQRLAASGREAILLARHREYFRELARRAEAERVSPREVHWLLQLRRELPNLRLAMESGLAEPGAAHVALEIAAAVQDLWLGTGQYREGQRWLTRALALDPRPTPLRAVALSLASSLTMFLGDTEASGRMLAEAQELADRLGDPAARAAVTLHRASRVTWAPPADLARGLTLYEQAMADGRAAGDLRLVSLCLLQSATNAAFLGDPRAGAHAEQLRTLGATHGAEWTTSWGRLILAIVSWQSGDQERAAALVREALPVIRLVHDSWAAGTCLEILAWTAAAAGHHEHAARLLGACQTIERSEGTPMAGLGPFAEHHARCERDARDALGADTYATAFDAGARFTLDEAIGHALGAVHTASSAPSRRPQQPGRGPLTQREQQIAHLVADGLTNREIGARLAISQRTAESHIQNILTKLGFSTRAQIATWITQSTRNPKG